MKYKLVTFFLHFPLNDWLAVSTPLSSYGCAYTYREHVTGLEVGEAKAKYYSTFLRALRVSCVHARLDRCTVKTENQLF